MCRRRDGQLSGWVDEWMDRWMQDGRSSGQAGGEVDEGDSGIVGGLKARRVGGSVAGVGGQCMNGNS